MFLNHHLFGAGLCVSRTRYRDMLCIFGATLNALPGP